MLIPVEMTPIEHGLMVVSAEALTSKIDSLECCSGKMASGVSFLTSQITTPESEENWDIFDDCPS